LITKVEPLRFIRSGIAASAIGHLSLLTMVVISTEVHPFSSVTAEPITVDLVSPAEVKEISKEEPPKPEFPKPELPKPEPSDAFDLSSKQAPPPAPAPAAPQEASPQKQAALTQKQAAPTPSPVKQPAAAQPPPQAASPVPSFVPPQPDLTIKYNVLLGLPPELPPTVPQDKPGDAWFDRVLRSDQDKIAGIDGARRQARRRSDPDRGQRIRQGTGADAKRDRGTRSLPALYDVAGRPLR
jgi:outer membrane biosynthesis protein TonB